MDGKTLLENWFNCCELSCTSNILHLFFPPRLRPLQRVVRWCNTTQLNYPRAEPWTSWEHRAPVVRLLPGSWSVHRRERSSACRSRDKPWSCRHPFASRTHEAVHFQPLYPVVAVRLLPGRGASVVPSDPGRTKLRSSSTLERCRQIHCRLKSREVSVASRRLLAGSARVEPIRKHQWVCPKRKLPESYPWKYTDVVAL